MFGYPHDSGNLLKWLGPKISPPVFPLSPGIPPPAARRSWEAAESSGPPAPPNRPEKSPRQRRPDQWTADATGYLKGDSTVKKVGVHGIYWAT